MDETATITADRVGFVRSSAPTGWVGAWSGVSWGAIIAGAFTAIAVTIIVVALGSGIGFTMASPYSYSPSAGTLTILGALWLVFAQAVGFATGGYVAARLRRAPADLHSGEVKFRDGAHGLTVWAIGVVVSTLILAGAMGKVGSAVTDTAAVGTPSLAAATAGGPPSMEYFTDSLLRTNPQAAANNAPPGAGSAGTAPANAPGNGANNRAQRDQVSRIMLTGLSPNGLSNEDRTYLAQIVAAQAGISQDDAQKRVDDVVNRAKQDATQAADTARKAAAYLSFWTFMSLLFGAVCATLGGLLGGDLRDDHAIHNAVPASPR
jgi:hypothetical protein